MRSTSPSYEYVTSRSRLGHVAREIAASQVVGIDLETTSLDPYAGEIRILSVATRDDVFVVDLFKTKGFGPIAKVLDNPDATRKSPLFVGHNLKFDQKWLLLHHDIKIWPLFDTYRASALLHCGRYVGNALTDLYHRELAMDTWTDQMGGAGWSGELSEKHIAYAAEDVHHLERLYKILREKLDKAGMIWTALIEFQAVLPEAAMENNGFRLDPLMWTALAERNAEKAQEYRDEVLRELPHPEGQQGLFGSAVWNPNSIQQVQASLRRCGIHLEDTKATTLAQVEDVYPQVALLKKYRDYSKKCSSFGREFLENINPHTGRIHTSYYPFLNSGRYASSSPNLQQIPRGSEFRECFRPEEGRKLIVCDYSQIELRLMAEISGDPTMRKVFLDGVDPHKYTAAGLLGVDIDEVSKKQRQGAKPLNFGLIYGLQPKKLVLYAKSNYGVSMTLSEAKQHWNGFFEMYSGVQRWQDHMISTAKPKGLSYSITGRRRFIDNPHEHNAYFNNPVQSSGADGLKSALWNVFWRLRPLGDEVKMVHMVHDEIVLEVPDDEDVIKPAMQELEEGMCEAMAEIMRSVPVEAEPSVGDSWAEK